MPIQSEVLSKTVINAKHAQPVNRLIKLGLDALLQDQIADATRSWMQATNAKPAHWTNLQTKVLPLVRLFQLVMPIQSEVISKTVINAKHAQPVNRLIKLGLDALLQDQIADATRSWMQATNVKPAHWTNFPTQVLQLVTPFQLAMPIQSEVMSKTVIDAKHAQPVNKLIKLGLDALLQDQIADATRSWMQATNAKPAHWTSSPTQVPPLV